MIKSMTGFGRGVYSSESRTITAEIKSVNHRYFEIAVKMPRRYQFAEEYVKSLVKAVTPRGKMDLSISVDDLSFESSDVRLNLEAAKVYYENLSALKNEFPNLSGEVNLSLLSSMPDVLKTIPAEEDEERIKNELTIAVNAALDNFNKMKATEGSKLIEDILNRGSDIQKTVDQIKEYAPSVKLNYKNKFRERLKELLEGADVPEDRILLEAAVFADKCDITEELTRLNSHCEQLRKLASSDEPVGKKLDFLVQEMNREANTIGSKANDLQITDKVLFLKGEIEKIREQVQNIE